MTIGFAHRRLMSLIHRSELSDRQLEELFEVHQTTVWRLKHGRIAKIEPYIAKLEAHLGGAAGLTTTDIVGDLAMWSEQSDELRKLLRALHAVMHDRA